MIDIFYKNMSHLLMLWIDTQLELVVNEFCHQIVFIDELIQVFLNQFDLCLISIAHYYYFFNVGPPKEDIFLTSFYGLYFSLDVIHAITCNLDLTLAA